MDGDIARFISEYLAEQTRAGVQMDCSTPEVYEQVMRDMATAMTTRRGGVVTAADMDRVVRATTELRSHPMLRRERYFSDVNSPQIVPTRSTASFDTSSNVFTRLWNSLAGGSDTYALLSGDEDPYADRHARERDEVRRVRSEIANKLQQAHVTEAWREFSSDVDDDFYMCVVAKYSTSVLRIVPEELKIEFSRTRASPHRPFLESWSSYNLGRATSIGRKHVVCTMFRFRYPSMPLPQ